MQLKKHTLYTTSPLSCAMITLMQLRYEKSLLQSLLLWSVVTAVAHYVVVVSFFFALLQLAIKSELLEVCGASQYVCYLPLL